MKRNYLVFLTTICQSTKKSMWANILSKNLVKKIIKNLSKSRIFVNYCYIKSIGISFI